MWRYDSPGHVDLVRGDFVCVRSLVFLRLHQLERWEIIRLYSRGRVLFLQPVKFSYLPQIYTKFPWLYSCSCWLLSRLILIWLLNHLLLKWIPSLSPRSNWIVEVDERLLTVEGPSLVVGLLHVSYGVNREGGSNDGWRNVFCAHLFWLPVLVRIHELGSPRVLLCECTLQAVAVVRQRKELGNCYILLLAASRHLLSLHLLDS